MPPGRRLSQMRLANRLIQAALPVLILGWALIFGAGFALLPAWMAWGGLAVTIGSTCLAALSGLIVWHAAKLES